MGLMQLMPETARLHNVVDAYDPEHNVDGGVRHLKMLLERYQGNLEWSLAAYNAGSGAVEKHRGIPPFAETREYVRRVLRFYVFCGDPLGLDSAEPSLSLSHSGDSGAGVPADVSGPDVGAARGVAVSFRFDHRLFRRLPGSKE
jgi:hypothetical protein